MIIGDSNAGRPIWAERFGTAGPTVLIVCGIHGNEASSVIFGDQLRSRLLGGWAERRGVCVVLVQAANPDGVTTGTRENARGVDLNRDFPASNTDDPDTPTQPETRCLVDLVETVDPAAILSIHCCEPLFDWDGPARPLAETMADAMAEDVRFPVERLGAHPGSLGSWAGRDRDIPVVTVEFDCHGPTDIRRQLDEVEASVDAAFRLAVRRHPPRHDGVIASGHRENSEDLFDREIFSSAGDLPIRLDITGDSSPPELLVLGGLADNTLRSRLVAEYLRRTLLCRPDGPSPFALLTAANPDGIADRSPLNADDVSVPDDVADADERTPEARHVVRTVDRLAPELVVSVEADDRADSAALLGLPLSDPNLATGQQFLSPVARRLADLGPAVLRLGVHHRPALGRGAAGEVPDPARFLETVLSLVPS